MILRPFRRNRRDPTIDALYGMIVAQARSAIFYRDYGVPDTVAGRMDMIILHLVLVLGRLAVEPHDSRGIGQRMFDRFCQDMDDNFREMGVGDLSVPKEMRRVAEAFYGRFNAYKTALINGDDNQLTEAVARNVFGETGDAHGARRLAIYMRRTVAHLATQETAAIARGELEFSDPLQVEPHRLEASIDR